MITTTSGAQLEDSEFVNLLRTEGLLGELVAAVSRRLQITQAAKDAGVTASPQELQAAADAFRISAGMRSAADTRRWLSDNQMSDDDFEAMIENRLLERKLEGLAPPDSVEERFEQERSRFDRIRIAQIVVGTLGLAEELVFRIRDDGADFHELAREHSLDDLTRDNGGHLGLADRNSFEAEIGEALFAAAPGEVVGPFSAEDSHYLFQVLEVLPAQFDENSRRLTRRLLLEDRLREVESRVEEALEEAAAR